jgi:hypothetical protein
MDDSADEERKNIFVVAGFLGQTETWFEAERHWERRVKDVGLDYFRATECHSLRGEFQKLVNAHGMKKAREIRDELLADLKSIIKSSNLLAFCFLGPIPDYSRAVADSYGPYVFERDPYIQAHLHLIYHVAAEACDHIKSPEPVAFVFDEHNKAAALQGRWPEVKKNSPIASRCMGTLAPLDDRISPAIQMGDLMAHSAKRAFEHRLDDLKSGLTDLQEWTSNLQWVASWDEKYLRDLMDASIDIATLPARHAFEHRKPT